MSISSSFPELSSARNQISQLINSVGARKNNGFDFSHLTGFQKIDLRNRIEAIGDRIISLINQKEGIALQVSRDMRVVNRIQKNVYAPTLTPVRINTNESLNSGAAQIAAFNRFKIEGESLIEKASNDLLKHPTLQVSYLKQGLYKAHQALWNKATLITTVAMGALSAASYGLISSYAENTPLNKYITYLGTGAIAGVTGYVTSKFASYFTKEKMVEVK